ncbi:MAG: hypothetical protein IJN25_04955 [Clostridia bacterium]|nr:hypothetical protein [Clostridia bacterium]
MRNLLENIGGKTKTLAVAVLILGSIVIITGLTVILIRGSAAGYAGVLAGGIVLLLGFLPMYAVGEIAERVQRQSWQNERILSSLKKITRAEQATVCNTAEDAAQQKNESEWHCTSCGKINSPAATYCRHCGKDG